MKMLRYKKKNLFKIIIYCLKKREIKNLKDIEYMKKLNNTLFTVYKYINVLKRIISFAGYTTSFFLFGLWLLYIGLGVGTEIVSQCCRIYYY